MKNCQYLFTAFMLLIVASAMAQQGTKNFIDQPYLEVRGEAEIKATPDEIYLRIVLNEDETKPRNTIELMENNLMRVLRRNDVDPKQLRVLEMSSDYKQQWLGKDIKEIRIFELLLHEASQTGEVLRDLREQEIGNVEVTRVDHSQMEELKAEAQVKALKNARQKAGKLAAALDQSVGKAIFVQEHQGTPRPMYQARSREQYTMRAKGAGALPQTLEFKQLEIQGAVLVRFVLN
ncbi:MAG: SIMPL domain-containing protein [Bacteroidota bacterium]